MKQPRSYSALDKARAMERAKATLRKDYERWVARGTMRASEADKHLSILDSIASDYRRLANQDQSKLFEDDHA